MRFWIELISEKRICKELYSRTQCYLVQHSTMRSLKMQFSKIPSSVTLIFRSFLPTQASVLKEELSWVADDWFIYTYIFYVLTFFFFFNFHVEIKNGTGKQLFLVLLRLLSALGRKWNRSKICGKEFGSIGAQADVWFESLLYYLKAQWLFKRKFLFFIFTPLNLHYLVKSQNW